MIYFLIKLISTTQTSIFKIKYNPKFYEFEVQRVDLAHKGIYYQAWGSELQLLDPHIGRRESIF